ncbi:MAG: SBBP repeat-containing protein [Bacteroidia bacterium]|nr:SBBP repeat-containing protein [Bacteroidia bacterium]
MRAVVIIIGFLSFFNLKAQMNLSWAKSIGSSGADEAQTIGSDLSGNVYVAGSFNGSVDFDPGSGIFLLTSAGATDGYVAKYDASGNFINAVSFTNNLECKVYSLAIDNLGNIIVTGSFTGSVDFEPGPGVTQLVAGGYYDIFLVKLTSSLGFVWAHRFGYAGGDDFGYSVATDNSNNILVTGYFQGPNIDFDPGGSTYYISSQGLKDIFVLKLDATANFLWAFGLGSSGSFQDVGHVIKTDQSNNIILGGYFSSSVDFDPGSGLQTLTAGGNTDAFIAKYTPSGLYTWAKSFIGSGNELCYGLQTDLLGDIYCTGTFAGGTLCDFDPGPASFMLQSNGIDQDVFLTKLSSSGNFVWAKALGGTLADFGRSVAVDMNKVYLSGYFNGVADLDPSAALNTFTSNGGLDFFITTLDLSGNYISAFAYGSVGNDYCNSISCTANGVLHAAGSYSSTVDFDSGLSTYTLSAAGSNDAYFFKLQENIVGIEENSINNNVQIFPNPTLSEFNIVCQKPFDLEIYDAAGSLVYSQKNCEPLWKTKAVLKSNGVYYIKIIDNDNTYSTKIIKQ